jgi:hypothetical protein
VYENIALSNQAAVRESKKTCQVIKLNNSKKMISAVVLAVILVSLLAGAIFQFFPTQEPTVKAASPIILPMPVTSPASNNQNTNSNAVPIQLDVTLSQNSDSNNHFNFNITQGNTITINVNLTSNSNDTEFTTPLYLSVGAFNNQPLPKIITSPQSPYPVLPWPTHEDSPNAAKPFEASFDLNPVALAPNESKTAVLTVTALENAQPGVYTMLIEMGNWKETGLGGVTFQLTVSPK